MHVNYDPKSRVSKVELLKRERDRFPAMCSLLHGIARNLNSQNAIRAIEYLEATLKEVESPSQEVSAPY